MKRDFLTMEQADVADITQLLKRAEFMESSISGQDKSLDIRCFMKIPLAQDVRLNLQASISARSAWE